MFEQLGLIGCGLIGGSFALALRRAGAVGRVVGIGRNPAALERARALGVIDEVATDWAQALDGADQRPYIERLAADGEAAQRFGQRVLVETGHQQHGHAHVPGEHRDRLGGLPLEPHVEDGRIHAAGVAQHGHRPGDGGTRAQHLRARIAQAFRKRGRQDVVVFNHQYPRVRQQGSHRVLRHERPP